MLKLDDILEWGRPQTNFDEVTSIILYLSALVHQLPISSEMVQVPEKQLLNTGKNRKLHFSGKLK